MPVLYVNPNKQESLQKEPYASFLKKYDVIKENLNGEQIELRVGGRENCFSNGFYVSSYYCKNPRLKINFATILHPDDSNKKCTLVRMVYSYDGENSFDVDFHIQRAKDVKKRSAYYYLPNVTHFEFSSQIDDEYRFIFDVLVEDVEKISEVCCSLINLVISIFSLDN